MARRIRDRVEKATYERPVFARRITLYTRSDGDIGYKVQAKNWQIIESSEEGFKQKRVVLARLAKKYPGVEIVDATA